jgi:hypothetical protein
MISNVVPRYENAKYPMSVHLPLLFRARVEHRNIYIPIEALNQRQGHNGK